MTYKRLMTGVAVAALMVTGSWQAQANGDGGGPLDWGGLYIGIHAGGAWGDRDGCIDVFDLNDSCSGLGGGPGIIPAFPFDYDQEGVIAGGQVGYNYQMNQFVIGAEVEGSFADVDGKASGPGPIGGPGEYNWLGAAKLRLGMALDQLLFFGVIGFSVADFEYEGGLGCDFQQTRHGLLLGGGVEWRLTQRASIKGEFNWRDYDKEDARCEIIAVIPTYVETDAEMFTATVGLNYAIGGQ